MKIGRYSIGLATKYIVLKTFPDTFPAFMGTVIATKSELNRLKALWPDVEFRPLSDLTNVRPEEFLKAVTPPEMEKTIAEAWRDSLPKGTGDSASS